MAYLSVLLLVFGRGDKTLKGSGVPAPLMVVVIGILLNWFFDWCGGILQIEANHLVQVPVAKTVGEFRGLLTMPNFMAWNDSAVYSAALSMAIITSMESLLNLTAVDKLDPQQRESPPNRELLVQGIGNCLLGLIGGIPMTAGDRARLGQHQRAVRIPKLATIWHVCFSAVGVVIWRESSTRFRCRAWPRSCW